MMNQAQARTPSLVRELEGEGLSISSDDSLTRTIADLESRLELIRETHLEQQMLEVDVLTREGELSLYRDNIAQRERSLSDTESSLRDREALFDRERGEFTRQREQITSRLHELEDIETSLRERDLDQTIESAELERERAIIESRRQALADEERTLGEREGTIHERASELQQEREALLQTQHSLEEDKRLVEAQAHEQKELSAQLESLGEQLDEREKEIESKFAEHDQLKDMLSTLTHQLDESRDQARGHAEEYERALKEKAEEAQRTEDLERRCRSLETERTRIRGELTKVRQELDAQEVFTSTRTALPAPTKRLSFSRAAQVGGGIWLSSVAIVGLGVGISISQGTMGVALGASGAAIALCLVASFALIGHVWDTSMLLIAGLVATVALWFPGWVEAAQTAVKLWQIPPEALPASMVGRIPLAFASVTAGLAIAACLFLLTNAVNVLGHAIFAVIVAGSLLLATEQTPMIQGVAAGIFVAIIASSLTQWGVRTCRAASGSLS